MLPEEWAEGLPVVPLTKEEVGFLLKQILERDEEIALAQLARNGSVLAGIIRKLGLTRPLLTEAFARLQGDRLSQVTLA